MLMGIDRLEDLHSWQEARREEKRKFYEVSHGSVEELQSHLYVALDQDYISKEGFQDAYNCADVVGKVVKGSIDNITKQINSRRRDRGRGR